MQVCDVEDFQSLSSGETIDGRDTRKPHMPRRIQRNICIPVAIESCQQIGKDLELTRFST